jgi:hypothetical protein
VRDLRVMSIIHKQQRLLIVTQSPTTGRRRFATTAAFSTTAHHPQEQEATIVFPTYCTSEEILDLRSSIESHRLRHFSRVDRQRIFDLHLGD